MCTFYERISELCKERGTSRSRVCLDLGLSKSTLSDIKSGRKSGVSAENAQKFADYFGVTVGYLLGKEEKTPTVTDGQKETPDQMQLTGREMTLLEMFRRFPEIQQDSLILMVEKFEAVPEASRESALEAFQGMLKMLQIL